MPFSMWRRAGGSDPGRRVRGDFGVHSPTRISSLTGSALSNTPASIPTTRARRIAGHLHPVPRESCSQSVPFGTLERPREWSVMPSVVDLSQTLSLFEETWSPKVVGRMNDYELKVVRMQGEFVWHSHDHTDEVFLVIEGTLLIQLRGTEDVWLRYLLTRPSWQSSWPALRRARRCGALPCRVRAGFGVPHRTSWGAEHRVRGGPTHRGLRRLVGLMSADGDSLSRELSIADERPVTTSSTTRSSSTPSTTRSPSRRRASWCRGPDQWAGDEYTARPTGRVGRSGRGHVQRAPALCGRAETRDGVVSALARAEFGAHAAPCHKGGSVGSPPGRLPER